MAVVASSASSRRSIVQRLDILLPHGGIHSDEIPVIRHHPIDFALDVCGLRPHAAGTCKQINLLAQLGEEIVAAVVPPVGAVGDLVRGLFVQRVVPGAVACWISGDLYGKAQDSSLLFTEKLGANPPKFPLQPDALHVIGRFVPTSLLAPERSAALRRGVVMVVLHIFVRDVVRYRQHSDKSCEAARDLHQSRRLHGRSSR